MKNEQRDSLLTRVRKRNIAHVRSSTYMCKESVWKKVKNFLILVTIILIFYRFFLLATKYEDECKTDEQCTPLLGELGKCVNRNCKCEIIHHHKDDRCYEKTPLDAPCERSSECFVTSEPDTVECRNSQCKCKLDHTPDVEAQACIKPRPVKKSK